MKFGYVNLLEQPDHIDYAGLLDNLREQAALCDDAGWEHYADRWDVVSPDGEVLASRVLLHPHENEQPFTRSLGGVAVPEGVTRVIIRAHDNVHGLGGQTVEVLLAE